ncbi:MULTISPECIES: glycosyltransferase family 9 protein [Dietzia]|uniref:glycosyltransferase family 9 protein n=1 Tax=Dietzia TaxID=37914 RepID=UPI000A752357|nr:MULTISPECIES: glycosyltransferase family 9 protein [Dietzia]MCT1641447.1 glycosyltransferase family 9 protein [Dietzia cinnamea]MCT2057701.1 glycosyltransferase family 9 protein [Dietzia cinnamea]MCT2060779.1 glycosyltransferase family 9 protein [Dietzia cinnamea]MCT2122217.1 glycosyltransferase family 9 protein [Dietzia cinnamea]MCT2143678.1 glycosyltransferase family 9 protein [Dietzia cinnamea]
MGRTLAVRLDSDGDVLLCGPALTLLAETGDEVDLLVSSQGLAAAGLLPAVSEVLVHDAPWSGFRPPPVDRAATAELVERITSGGYDRAVVFTSFHQSPLPMALLLRLAGVPFIAAASVDYPGSLLDVRVRRDDPPGGGHEVEAAVEIAVAAGARRPARIPGLAVRHPLPDVTDLLPGDGRDLVVVHPGASVPARSLTPVHAGRIVAALRDAGYLVAVTGGPGERDLVARTLAACPGGTGGGVLDLAGRTDLAQLAAVLERAAVVVVGNTGPAHLAAAVGTPVVSLFSPVVPADRWAPWGVPVRLLGDQHAPCRDTRARECPVDGHPCLTGVPPDEVVAAVTGLATERRTRCAS